MRLPSGPDMAIPGGAESQPPAIPEPAYLLKGAKLFILINACAAPCCVLLLKLIARPVPGDCGLSGELCVEEKLPKSSTDGIPGGDAKECCGAVAVPVSAVVPTFACVNAISNCVADSPAF